jgi:ribosomal protein S27E
MHRPLPEGQIKGAWAQCRFVGGRAEWEIVFSVDLGDQPARQHEHPTRTIAIDIGWRRRENGMRVAYWRDDRGEHGEIVVPIAVEQRKGKSDDLRSIRDLRRNEMTGRLREWVEATPGTWLDEALAHARQWIRMGHFIKLEQRWRNERVLGDVRIYDDLTAFLKKDRHLYAWQAHNLVKMERQIRGRFAAIAHDMCSQYGVVALEAMNLTQLKEAEDEGGRINARSIQRLAPGELRVAIKQAASKYGTVVHELEAAYTTLDCAECGHRREPEDRAALVLTCEKCGHAEDQDLTAGRNLLRASGTLRDQDGKPLDPKAARTSAKKLAPRRTRKRVADRPLATE